MTAQPTVSPHSVEQMTELQLVGIMIGITTACFLVLMDFSVLVTAVPQITTRFHSLFDIGWYGGAYNLGSAALQPTAGQLYAYLPAKAIFLVFFLIFEAGSLICALAPSSPIFIVGRGVAGIGASGLQSGAITIIAKCAPLERRPLLTGIVLGLGQIGLVAGPLIGGAITEYSNWRWCFYINLPIGAIVVVILLIAKFPDRQATQTSNPSRLKLVHLDIVGFFLFAPFAVLTLLALQYGGHEYSWKSPTVIGLFCGGAIAFCCFILWEGSTRSNAMVPMNILICRQIWTSCLIMLFLLGSIIATSYYMAIYFQAVKSMTPFMSGVNTIPLILSQVIGAILSGIFVQHFGYYILAMIVGGAMAVAGNCLLSTLTASSSVASWVGIQVLAGFGRGISFQQPVLAVQAHTKAEVTPQATATLVFCQTFGSAVFICAANAIFSNKLASSLSTYLPPESVDIIIRSGGTSLSELVSSDVLGAVQDTYVEAISSVFYLVTAASVCVFILSWGIGFTDIRKEV